MPKAPRYYMRVTADNTRLSISFGVNLRTPEAIYCFAFANLLMSQYQGHVESVARLEDPPDAVIASATIGFAGEAFHAKAIADCGTYLTSTGRVLPSYRAPLTRADPRLRQSQALLDRARTAAPVSTPGG